MFTRSWISNILAVFSEFLFPNQYKTEITLWTTTASDTRVFKEWNVKVCVWLTDCDNVDDLRSCLTILGLFWWTDKSKPILIDWITPDWIPTICALTKFGWFTSHIKLKLYVHVTDTWQINFLTISPPCYCQDLLLLFHRMFGWSRRRFWCVFTSIVLIAKKGCFK